MSDKHNAAVERSPCDGCGKPAALAKHSWRGKSLCPRCYGQERGYYAEC